MKVVLESDILMHVEAEAESLTAKNPAFNIWNAQPDGMSVSFPLDGWIILAKSKTTFPIINVYLFTTEEAANGFMKRAAPNFAELTWLQQPGKGKGI